MDHRQSSLKRNVRLLDIVLLHFEAIEEKEVVCLPNLDKRLFHKAPSGDLSGYAGVCTDKELPDEIELGYGW